MTTRGACRWLVVALLGVSLGGCADSNGAGDTLAPLPVPSATGEPASSNAASSEVTIVTSTSEDAADPLLVGDWDGAEFDVGVISTVGELGGYRTIDFDRYSYEHPDRGVIDAAAFTEEPIAYGWTESPYVNIQEQLRTFVLADDVEVLVPGGDAGVQDCTDDSGRPPRPEWISAGASYLDQPAVTDDIATLTYSDDGLVTRVRFTRGCDD